MRHGSPNFKHLLVAGNKLVKLQTSMRIDRQVTDLVLAHVHVYTLIVCEAPPGVDNCDHLILIDLLRI